MIIKKLSPILILLSLGFLLFTVPSGVAEEAKTFSETKLEIPEGSLISALQGTPDGSILALAADDGGAYHLLRWEELSGAPEVIPVSLTDLEGLTMDVAPDGGIILSTIREAKAPDADGVLNMQTVAVWIDASGQEISRIIMEDIVPKRKALSGKRIACISLYDELVIYDDMGNALMTENVNGLQSLIADEDVLYGFTREKVYEWSLHTYDQISNETIGSYSLDRITMATDGAIYFVSDKGINQLDLKNEEIYVRMETLGTYLEGWNYYTSGLVALPDNVFVLLAKSMGYDEDSFIVIYREMEAVQNRTPFIITNIRGDLLLETAASEFQRLHPELKVEVTTVRDMAALNELPVEDLIRTVNTELLAGGGGDVLLLDRLPMDVIISRGLLLDITHITEDVQLLPGISDSIRHTDGKIYAIPTEFSVLQLFGKKSTIESIKTLPDILNVPLDQGQMRLPMSTQLALLFSACKQDFINDKGEIMFQSEAFIEFLNTVYSVFDEIDREAFGISDENRITMDKASLKNEAIALYPAEAKYLSDVEDYYDQYRQEESAIILMPSLYGSGSAYRPRTILGIPKSAQNPSLSEEFIRLMLSTEMQLQSPLLSGFSTVEKKLDRLFERRIEMSYKYPTLYKQGEDGVQIIKSPSEDFFRSVREKLDVVSVPFYDDSTILMFIEEGVAAFLDGTITAEEAAQNIERRAWFYLNE